MAGWAHCSTFTWNSNPYYEKNLFILFNYYFGYGPCTKLFLGAFSWRTK